MTKIDETAETIETDDAPIEGEVLDPIAETERLLPTIFDDSKVLEGLVTRLETELLAIDFDMDKPADRKKCRGLARKVASARVLLDEKRKEKTEEARKFIADTNAFFTPIKERLEVLQKKVRAPLTAHEEAEAKRKAEIAKRMETLEALAKVDITMTAAEIQEQLDKIEATPLDESWGDALAEAQITAEGCREALNIALDFAKQREAQAAELAALKAQQEKEAAERAAQEAAEKAEREAKEKAEREARKAAEAKQREAEERAAAAERAAKEAKEQAEAAQKAEAERKEREAQEKAAKEQAEREAQEKAEREAEAARMAAKEKAEKRDEMRGEAIHSLHTACGLIESTCAKIIDAIAAGKVANVKVEWVDE